MRKNLFVVCATLHAVAPTVAVSLPTKRRHWQPNACSTFPTMCLPHFQMRPLPPGELLALFCRSHDEDAASAGILGFLLISC
ncbi:hypothetical protein DUNSADRAFT_8436 [Dunaliella salina]|uniref:Secreted protein n=1 Tax=Dunaliella salina TaxID=3046 RepID=A0ABQ7GJL8_DUNSA|nr:hypothetical protein DUNSADRAFT_8436 [Dunaliella salina]|eukprot:KAF5834795.1 hypothetical protein DUNSADRAFT_8436 [Dunaliella salina]